MVDSRQSYGFAWRLRYRARQDQACTDHTHEHAGGVCRTQVRATHCRGGLAAKQRAGEGCEPTITDCEHDQAGAAGEAAHKGSRVGTGGDRSTQVRGEGTTKAYLTTMAPGQGDELPAARGEYSRNVTTGDGVGSQG